MNEEWKLYLILTLLAIFVQGFFAMLEMACISFNKVRLQYYVAKKQRRAIWLSYLLNHPALFFGTCLIAITTALLVGSECARRFYIALHLDPDWAALSQILIVLIFAEIAPMVAGLRFSEHIAMIGIPVIYFTSILLRPVIWLLDLFCQCINWLFGIRTSAENYLSRDELQKIIEEREETPDKFNTIVANIFSLKNKTAKELMQHLTNIQLIPASCNVSELRKILSTHYTPFIPIYQKTSNNIVAIAYPRDLLRVADEKRVREYARPPWFIAESASILQIIKQFRRNKQTVAVVLNEAGLATGILSLDEIIDEIFGRIDNWMSLGEAPPTTQQIVVDRTFPGDTLISDFNKNYHVHLSSHGAETLEKLMEMTIGHKPTKGESVRIDNFELTVEESTVFGTKMISVRSVY